MIFYLLNSTFGLMWHLPKNKLFFPCRHTCGFVTNFIVNIIFIVIWLKVVKSTLLKKKKLSSIALFIIYIRSSNNKSILFLPIKFKGPTKIATDTSFDRLLTYNIIMFKPFWMKESFIVLKLPSHIISAI